MCSGEATLTSTSEQEPWESIDREDADDVLSTGSREAEFTNEINEGAGQFEQLTTNSEVFANRERVLIH